MSFLQNGHPFPAISAPRIGGGTLSLPGDLAGSYGVVLFYRGSWCPYCNAQLSGFEHAKDRLANVGVKVVALSVDDEATTRDLIAKHKISFPIGYGADARAIAAATGAYLNEDPLYMQTTGFVLAPDGTVVNAVYSSSAIGRLVAEDVVGLVSYIKYKV
jgi:peroxiredoxin